MGVLFTRGSVKQINYLGISLASYSSDEEWG